MKGFIHILVLIVLLIGVAVGGFLVQQKTNFLSKALFESTSNKNTSTTNPLNSTADSKNSSSSKKPSVSVFERLALRNINTPIIISPTAIPPTPIPASPTNTPTPTPRTPTSTPAPTHTPTPTSTPVATPTLDPTPTSTTGPVIANISPLNALAGGVVSITGQNLRPAGVDEATLRVTLRHSDGSTITLAYATPASSNVSWSDTSIAFTLGSLTAQTGNIVITVGTQSVTSSQTFTISEVGI